MPPKRCRSERLGSNSSESQCTSADQSKRRRTDPGDEGKHAVLSTPTSSNDHAVSTVSSTELEDHEVSILLGTLTMSVRRRQLRDSFGYFAKFTMEGFPKKFSLSPKNDPENWSSCWLLPSEGATPDDNEIRLQFMDNSEVKDSFEAHKSLLELICLDLPTLRTSFKEREPSFWVDVAALLARYEAVDSIKLEFDGYLLETVVENDLLRNDPCVMLEIGYHLKRAEFFRAGMMEVVRQFHATKTDVDHLPNDLQNSVLNNVRKLEVTVRQIWENIIQTLCSTANPSSMLASGIILQRLVQDHDEAVFLLEPTDLRVYHALRALRDWHWEKFEDRIVSKVYSQLLRHDRIVEGTRDVIHGTKGRVEGADELEEELNQANDFGIAPVRHEGQRMLREIFDHIDPFMDDERSFFHVDPPTEFPWD